MRECSNPHIVQYYGAFLEDVSVHLPATLALGLMDEMQNDSQIGICMEYCEGGSLETLYKKTKAKGWRTGEKVLGKVAESVS
jgi:mitogen-activated protein kinase kinase